MLKFGAGAAAPNDHRVDAQALEISEGRTS
jgi:hypothetical protein